MVTVCHNTVCHQWRLQKFSNAEGKTGSGRERVSSFLTAHQHILGYLVSDDGLKDVIKEKLFSYNEIRKANNTVKSKSRNEVDKYVKTRYAMKFKVEKTA